MTLLLGRKAVNIPVLEGTTWWLSTQYDDEEGVRYEITRKGETLKVISRELIVMQKAASKKLVGLVPTEWDRMAANWGDEKWVVVGRVPEGKSIMTVGGGNFLVFSPYVGGFSRVRA